MVATPRNELYTDVPIDSTGTLTDPDGNAVEMKATGEREAALHIEGSASASFAVQVGVEADDGSIRWFDADRTYDSTDVVSDQWTCVEDHLRVQVSTAAGTGGATADVYLALV